MTLFIGKVIGDAIIAIASLTSIFMAALDIVESKRLDQINAGFLIAGIVGTIIAGYAFGYDFAMR